MDYSLVTHKKGFYLVGYSHEKAQRISLGIDGILEATRRSGDVFAYPEPGAYDPREMFKDSIGMFVGTMTSVVVRFDKTELESLVLSYGEKAEVIAPPALRRKMREVLRRAAARYGG